MSIGYKDLPTCLPSRRSCQTVKEGDCRVRENRGGAGGWGVVGNFMCVGGGGWGGSVCGGVRE